MPMQVILPLRLDILEMLFDRIQSDIEFFGNLFPVAPSASPDPDLGFPLRQSPGLGFCDRQSLNRLILVLQTHQQTGILKSLEA